ncbi:MAG: NUDIX domain-containing protein [Acidobacteriota bacterium]|nr:NUDIX domain-containing protein [Acidobacteriota bacterium]
MGGPNAKPGTMQREFSAGGVVVRRVGQDPRVSDSTPGPWEIAVIEPRREVDGDPGKTVLALPKGWVDPGEKPEQAACREVKEEAGLDAEIISKLGDIKYVYVRKWSDGARVFKIVSFYLLRYTGGTIGEISDEMKHEVRGARWIPLADAPRLLAYKGERDMVKKAADSLAANPESA